MGHTHTPTEWAASFLPGIGAVGVIAFALAFAGADAAYFDPRRLLDTDIAARLIVAFFNAKTSVREAVLDVAALIVLLTTSPKGAMA